MIFTKQQLRAGSLKGYVERSLTLLDGTVGTVLVKPVHAQLVLDIQALRAKGDSEEVVAETTKKVLSVIAAHVVDKSMKPVFDGPGEVPLELLDPFTIAVLGSGKGDEGGEGGEVPLSSSTEEVAEDSTQ